jgi:PAS domain S-box-containing protein
VADDVVATRPVGSAAGGPVTASVADSEARLRLATDAAGIGIHDFDPLSGTVQWDSRTRELWGVGPDEPVTYATWAGGLHPDDLAATEAAVARALDPGGDGRYFAEYRVINGRDRALRWVRATGQAYFAGGRAVRLVGTVQDITARKNVQLTLQTVYEVSPLLMGTVELLDDGDIRHLYDNPATQRFFALAPGSTAGRTARELGVSEATLDSWRRQYELSAARHGPVSFEYTDPGDDRQRTLAVTVAPLGPASPSGNPAFCYVAEDVTERRRAERELADAVAQLEQADRRKDRFLAMLSHELRNPLAPIRTAAHILEQEGVEPAKVAWARAVIQRQVSHMALLLDDLLDVARITQGKLEIRPRSVELATVVDAAVEAARPWIDEKHHRLEVSMPDTLPRFEADPLRLAQVLSNLLTNAAKYTDPGGRIELVVTVERSELCIAVRDDGIGIPGDALDGIFSMFSQLDTGGGRAAGGLGIGLALVKGLVALHGGRVEARSGGTGCGSTFVVRLPLADPLPVVTPGPENGGTARAAPSPDCSGLRILVVDDNRDAADSLGMLLELSGHNVRVAHGGQAGIALARTFQPHVALVDLGMPEVDGHAVARALRAEPWPDGLRLYALTGRGQEEDRRRALAAGFDEHLTKPVDPERLDTLLAAEAKRRG